MAPSTMSTATSYTQAPKLRVNASNDAAAEVKQTPPEPVTEAKATALDEIKRGDGRNHVVAADERPYLSYPLPKRHAGLREPDCMSYPPVNGRSGRAGARDTSIKDAQTSNKVSHSKQRPKSSAKPANGGHSQVAKGDRTAEEGVPLLLAICVTRRKLFSNEYVQTCRHPPIHRLRNDKEVFQRMRDVAEECKPKWAKRMRYLIPFFATTVCLSTISYDENNPFDVWGTERNTPLSKDAEKRYICIKVKTNNPALSETFLTSRFNNLRLCNTTRSAWYRFPKRIGRSAQMPDPATGSEFFSAAAEEHGVEIVTHVAKARVAGCFFALLLTTIAIVVRCTGRTDLWTLGSLLLTALIFYLGLWRS